MAVASARIWKFFLLGVFVHVLYLAAIFDVYFKSPLVQNLTPLPVTTKAPAERLVLFIADGLRADRFYQTSDEYPKSRAPFLRDIIEKRGSWGVSHARVPTETRPGHVAIIAGIFEDVSAVTKGWQENPVDFDTVFNESRLSFCWGSCEVIPMFSSKAARNNVIGKCYKEDMIDFADENGDRLDEWVFLEVEQFFKTAKSNHTLKRQLKTDKLVFFLHLLGLDVNGHGYRPNSQEYLNNIRSADAGIKRMVNLFESFYDNDGKTAYLMTADHGMSDWGSHGSGNPDETLTPIVAWGAGIQGPVMIDDGNIIPTDPLSHDWQLDKLRRLDVNQIDIAALMSALVGIPFPVNSLGVLPIDYLDASERFKAENLFLNAKQILAQYKMKQSTVKANALFFRPYALSGSLQEELIRSISSLIREGRHRDAMEKSRSLIQQSIDGLRYYHSHNTIYIAFCATFGFVGWIFLVIIEIFQNYSALDLNLSHLAFLSRSGSQNTILKRSFGAAALVLLLLMVITSASFMEYLYCFMPLLVFYELASEYTTVKSLANKATTASLANVFGFIAVYFMLLVSLVGSFTQRGILSLLLLGIAVFPILTRRKATLCTMSWLLATVVLSIFPLLPNIGREENYGLVALAGLLTAATSLIYACLPENATGNSIVVTVLVGAVTLCTFLRMHTAQSINAKAGLPVVDQILSWLLVPSLPSLALLARKSSISRLVSVVTSLIAVYILMCISHEGIFVYILSLSMFLWIKMEQELLDESDVQTRLDSTGSANSGHLSTSHVRIAYTFLFFIFLAFFGTGNIASLNSFDPAAVNCFITIFKPFIMAFFLFVKVLIPLVIVCCAFSAMKNSIGVEVRGLFYVVMVMTDIMAIMFFFCVKDEGSWQEIGITITHFVIMLAFIIFLVPLFELSCLLTGAVTLERKKQHVN